MLPKSVSIALVLAAAVCSTSAKPTLSPTETATSASNGDVPTDAPGDYNNRPKNKNRKDPPPKEPSPTTTRTGLKETSTSAGLAGPLLPNEFSDPCIVQLKNGSYYAFSTTQPKSGNAGNIHVPIANTEGDIASGWTNLNKVDALPDIGTWAISDQPVWGPDVHERVSCFFPSRSKSISFLIFPFIE